MTDQSFVSMKLAIDAKHAVLTLVKIKHRAPEVRLNPCLIYLSILEQMSIELTYENVEEHGSTGVRCLFCTKSDVTLRHDVQKAIHFRHQPSKI